TAWRWCWRRTTRSLQRELTASCRFGTRSCTKLAAHDHGSTRQLMQCENCGTSEATVHYTHIDKNEMQNLHLCEGCAIAKGLQPGTPVGNFPLTDFIAQMSRA